MSDLGPGAPPPPGLEQWVTDAEIEAVLGGPPLSTEPLAHNPLNAVTGGIWKVTTADQRAVVKVLTDGRTHDGPARWRASDDPTHWNSWRRELLCYAEDLPRWFRPEGVDAPHLLQLDDRGDGIAVLWLEYVDGRTGGALTVDDLVDLAAALGRAQGRLAVPPGEVTDADEPWLSREFLASYPESKAEPGELGAVLDDDAAWAHPRVNAYLGNLRDALRALHDRRGELYAIAKQCPRTLCHLDVWPANTIRRPDGRFVLVDWSFCGDGAMGEDVANLVPDAVFDLLFEAHVLPELATRAEVAYLEGARERGFTGDGRWIRLGLRAAAAKYHWLVRPLVEQPDLDPAVVYGGRRAPADDVFAARAAGLALLCRWADEAFALAAELGLDL